MPSLARLTIVAFACFAATTATAQSFFRPSMDRAGRWDLTLGIVQQGSETVSGAQGSSLELDSELGWRFAFDYNFNNHFALGFGLEFIRPDYTATIVPQDTGIPEQVSYTADQFNGQLKGIWNIFDGPLTPYVEASIGWTSLDSNVADGPPITGCWYDPLLGYICSQFWSTYNSSNLSYGTGVGLRWDINEQFFATAGAHILFIDASNSADLQFPSARALFGWRF
jgi:opacity protein-like surface antigen